jgi:hypothetical protein
MKPVTSFLSNFVFFAPISRASGANSHRRDNTVATVSIGSLLANLNDLKPRLKRLEEP